MGGRCYQLHQLIKLALYGISGTGSAYKGFLESSFLANPFISLLIMVVLVSVLVVMALALVLMSACLAKALKCCCFRERKR